MPINKVVFGDRTLIDITDTRFNENQLPVGTVVYSASGVRTIGNAIIHNVYINTTESWDSDITLVPNEGDLIIYSDKFKMEEGGVEKDVPGIKIGDGNAHLIDLPFITDAIDQTLLNHINDMTNHVSQEDRDFWNNKLNLDVFDEILIFNRL